MLPASSSGQLVLYANLEIAPNALNNQYVDYWGTQVSSFEILTPHRELCLTATSLVEVQPREHRERLLEWGVLSQEIERATLYVEQLTQTPLTVPPEEVIAMAREVVANHRPCDAAMAICTAIGERIEYVPGSTGVHTTASEAWSQRKGVCQDITHLAIGALRSVGIPARYVSGYLHPDPDAALGQTVTGESHAWVEWFCGDWRGFDPTNQIDIGDRHVLLVAVETTAMSRRCAVCMRAPSVQPCS